MAATWWEDSVFDLQTAASRGWKAVLDGWFTTAKATDDDKHAADLADQTAVRLLARDALAERGALAAEVARLDAEIRLGGSSGGEDDDDGEPEDILNPEELKRARTALALPVQRLG